MTPAPSSQVFYPAHWVVWLGARLHSMHALQSFQLLALQAHGPVWPMVWVQLLRLRPLHAHAHRTDRPSPRKVEMEIPDALPWRGKRSPVPLCAVTSLSSLQSGLGRACPIDDLVGLTPAMNWWLSCDSPGRSWDRGSTDSDQVIKVPLPSVFPLCFFTYTKMSPLSHNLMLP